jgi:hypothetical protein
VFPQISLASVGEYELGGEVLRVDDLHSAGFLALWLVRHAVSVHSTTSFPHVQ